MEIRKKKIGEGYSPYMIAEIGINHDGDFDTCIKLLDMAKSCGVDAAKLQVFVASQFLSNSSEYLKVFSEMSFSESQYMEIFKEAERIDLTLFASVFDFDSLSLLERLKVPAYKIASGDITHIPLILEVSKTGKPIILSTGGTTMSECQTAVNAIRTINSEAKIALLHCVSNYPLNFKDANLATMISLRQEFDLPVGFSDHSIGSELPLAAVALGANIIEKHFTLDTNSDGLDHASSADPKMMKMLVNGVNNVFKAIGSAKNHPSESSEQIKNIRRSLTANCVIEKDEVIDISMLSFKRPATGISPGDLDKVLGRRVVKRIEKDSPIQWEHVSRRNGD